MDDYYNSILVTGYSVISYWIFFVPNYL